MANKKITQFTSETSPDAADVIPIVDVAPTPINKKITFSALVDAVAAAIPSGAVSWASINFTGSDLADLETRAATSLTVTQSNILLGRATAGAGAVEEIACTAFGRSLLDDADAATARGTIGLATSDSPQFTDLTLSGRITVNGASTGTSHTNSAFVFNASSAGANDVLMWVGLSDSRFFYVSQANKAVASNFEATNAMYSKLVASPSSIYDILIYCQNPSGDWATQAVRIRGATAYVSATGSNQDGGDIYLYAGDASGAGTEGNVEIRQPDATTPIAIFNSTLTTIAGEVAITAGEVLLDNNRWFAVKDELGNEHQVLTVNNNGHTNLRYETSQLLLFLQGGSTKGAFDASGNFVVGGFAATSKLDVIGGNIELGDSYGYYYGDPTTNNSWRTTRSGDNLVFQRRESGSWIDKGTITTGGKHYDTAEGGKAVKLTNKTGSNSVKGTIVAASSTTDNAFGVAGASALDAIGVVYENGIADGSECLVVFSGIVEVLLKDTTASTRGYWVGVSDTAGRAYATASSPPAAPDHFKEIGHCLESKTSGTDVLAKIMLHFN